jgi:hypothetical protein
MLGIAVDLERLQESRRVWRVRPHVGSGMTGISGSQRLPDGSSLSVAVTTCDHHKSRSDDSDRAVIIVDVPRALEITLSITEVLALRMLGLDGDHIGSDRRVWVTSAVLKHAQDCDIFISHVVDGESSSSSSSSSDATWLPFTDATLLQFSSTETHAAGIPGNIAAITLPPGKCVRYSFKLDRNTRGVTELGPAIRTHPNPFPPPAYRAYFLGFDHTTAGGWMGSYGGSGYFLAAFDGRDQHVMQVSVCLFVLFVESCVGCDLR